MPSLPKRIRPTARLMLQDSRRTWNTTALNRGWIHSICSVPNALCVWTTIMLWGQTKMSRLRHVCIYVMQVNLKVKNTWYGTTSAVKNWSCLKYCETSWITFQCATAQPSICGIYSHFVEARADESSEELASATKISAIDEIDPSSDDFPNNQVHLDEVETTQLASELASVTKMTTTISKYKTR